jgi:hypothetical protein
MQQVLNQAQLNRRQVVVSQLAAEVQARASEWAALSRKAQIEAWQEWLATPAQQRVFLPFHRVLSVVEVVH